MSRINREAPTPAAVHEPGASRLTDSTGLPPLMERHHRAGGDVGDGSYRLLAGRGDHHGLAVPLAVDNQIRSKALPPGAGSEHWRKDGTDARRANPLEPGVVLMSEDGPQPWLRTFRAHGPSPTLDAGLLPAASNPSSVPSPLHTPRLPDRNGKPQPLSKTQTCHCRKSAMTVSHRAAPRT